LFILGKTYALFSSRQYIIIVINCIVPSIIIIYRYLLCLTKIDFICSRGHLTFFLAMFSCLFVFCRIVYCIGFNMGRQLDELSVFFWRLAIYLTSLCYCFMLLANKLMMMMIVVLFLIHFILHASDHRRDRSHHPSVLCAFIPSLNLASSTNHFHHGWTIDSIGLH